MVQRTVSWFHHDRHVSWPDRHLEHRPRLQDEASSGDDDLHRHDDRRHHLSRGRLEYDPNVRSAKALSMLFGYCARCAVTSTNCGTRAFAGAAGAFFFPLVLAGSSVAVYPGISNLPAGTRSLTAVTSYFVDGIP